MYFIHPIIIRKKVYEKNGLNNFPSFFISFNIVNIPKEKIHMNSIVFLVYPTAVIEHRTMNKIRRILVICGVQLIFKTGIFNSAPPPHPLG